MAFQRLFRHYKSGSLDGWNFGLLGPKDVRAQALLGEIDGNITDSTQASIIGASVVVTNTGTNFSRQTVTNSVGGYAIPDLPPGTYTIVVTAPGFQTFNEAGAAVAPNAVLRVDVTLTVGQVSETVAVIASAAALQTDRADVRAEMTQQTLANGADWTQLPDAVCHASRYFAGAER
jgi:hypothetical protein